MTEKRWFEAQHPYQMLTHPGCRSDRKRRLLACACARRVFPHNGNPDVMEAIEEAERFADGLATEADVKAVHGRLIRKFQIPGVKEALTKAGRFAVGAALCAGARRFTEFKNVIDIGQDVAEAVVKPDTPDAGSSLLFLGVTLRDVRRLLDHPRWSIARAEEAKAQCGLVREIFGNPFHPSTVDPAWLVRDIPAIARAIHEEWAFDRLPILGDAIEEAGCADAAILDHCRSDAEHVRGCWVVDVVLGRD